jgi:hypothetical protein
LSAVAESYELEVAPHEALGRAARRLSGGGAVYLGGGVGAERQGPRDGGKFVVTQAGKKGGETFPGPLSAVARAYALAGGSTAPDSPGGTTVVSDPAVAARIRELDAEAASARRDIDRFERRLRQGTEGSPYLGGPTVSDDGWERRRIGELKARLTAIQAERKRLIGGDLSEAETRLLEEVGKPGTNWKQVTPRAKAKLSGLIKHYMKNPHPFTACVRDNRKRFGDRAEKVCAVLKDLGKQGTDWRKGGKKVREEIEAAVGRILIIEDVYGVGSAVKLAEAAGTIGDPELDKLGELAYCDLGLLYLADLATLEEGLVPDAYQMKVRRMDHVLGAPVFEEAGERLPWDAPHTEDFGGFDEKEHPRGADGKWIRKGAWAIDRFGGLVQISDPTPKEGPDVPAHHRGRISVKGGSGSMAAVPSELTPAGDVKIKKAATLSGTGTETKRYEVRVDGEHIGDLAYTEASHGVLSGRIQVGSRRVRFWHALGPGERVKSSGSGHSARAAALDRLMRDHLKKKSGG